MDKAFVKGLRLIEILARSDRPRGVTDLAGELELTKSNVHRLLNTLVAHGYVHQVAQLGSYGLTTKLWELGSLSMSRFDLAAVAHDPMATLAERTRETVHLSILDGTEVIYVDKIESLQPVRAYTRIGGRAPAWCVATGKAMLAHRPAADVDRVAAALGAAFTRTTLTTAADLAAELARIRAQGYAVNRGEWREDVCGIATAIFDSSDAVVGAVGISGPASRLKPKRIKELAPDVVSAAAAISTALGYRPSVRGGR